jgi:hypothetical protein
MPATPALSTPWRVSWQVWPATTYVPEQRGRGGRRHQPAVQHRDFADEVTARHFAQLLLADATRLNGTCLVDIRNLTPRTDHRQPALPGAEDFPWRACKAPST